MSSALSPVITFLNALFKASAPTDASATNEKEFLNLVQKNYPNLVATQESDKKETEKWIKLFLTDFLPFVASKDAKLTAKLHKINKDLLTSVFFIGGTSPSLVDFVFFPSFHQLITDWSEADRVAFLNITRWFDYLQHNDTVKNTNLFATVKINKNVVVQEKPKQEAKPEKKDEKKDEKKEDKKEEKKEEGKDQKKEQAAQPKKQAAKAPSKADDEKVDVSRLDIRVGKIVNVKVHDQADTLYIEEIDLGESQPRQVVSGLRKFIPIEEMQNRLVVVLCNLKATKLKGVNSQAMVLAASNADHSQVELLIPPPDSKIGERVSFEGYPGDADAELNPKKKVWESVQPDFVTTDEKVAVYKGVPFKTSAGIITVKSITKGTIK